MNGDNCSRQNEIKENPNPNKGAASANKLSRVMQDPLDAPLMGSNMIQGPKTERRRRSAGSDSGRQIVRMISVDSDEFGLETSAIVSVLKLSFQPYKGRPNPTPYATWASVLVRAVFEVRN